MIASEQEMIAILQMKHMLRARSPNMSNFLRWISDRLVHVHHESENIDFVLVLRKYAEDIATIERTLEL